MKDMLSLNFPKDGVICSLFLEIFLKDYFIFDSNLSLFYFCRIVFDIQKVMTLMVNFYYISNLRLIYFSYLTLISFAIL